MTTIKDFLTRYREDIHRVDLELLIASAIDKPREFVLAYPEYKLTKYQVFGIRYLVSRRAKNTPLSYLLGYKEFFGLKFRVNKNVLIPRPETEMLVESALGEIPDTKYQMQNNWIIDVGTGSGNIIIALSKKLKANNKFIGIDISQKALAVARQNAKLHGVEKKIKFFQGNLLIPILRNNKYILPNAKYIILANLPYLSKKIYAASPEDVRKFEPRSALLSGKSGLEHYENLLKQMQKFLSPAYLLHTTCYLEISPEQKNELSKTIIKIFPRAKIAFQKDLSGRWRLCRATFE